MKKTKQTQTIVKINAPLAQANEWAKKAKELKMSRSTYLLGLINKSNESQKWFSFEEILKKFKK
jgi:hypothetical protein